MSSQRKFTFALSSPDEFLVIYFTTKIISKNDITATWSIPGLETKTAIC